MQAWFLRLSGCFLPPGSLSLQNFHPQPDFQVQHSQAQLKPFTMFPGKLTKASVQLN